MQKSVPLSAHTQGSRPSSHDARTLDGKALLESLRGKVCSFPQQHGVLVLDKPSGVSSAACIATIKHVFGQKKIGHAGTLDPMATGVLLVLLGEATKLSGYLLDAGRKTYSGSIKLGVVTDTWDIEGHVLEESSPEGIDSHTLQEAFAPFVGTYEQEVPAYSAAKFEGKPLYALARQGLETPVKKKTITIFQGEAELVGLPFVHFRVECSSGTYIRSLAHSLGKRLGCGATLASLTREYSHPFGLDAAVGFDTLSAHPEELVTRTHGIASALPDWARVALQQDLADKIRHGMPLAYASLDLGAFVEGRHILFENEDGVPLALAEATSAQGREQVVVSRGLWNR